MSNEDPETGRIGVTIDAVQTTVLWVIVSSLLLQLFWDYGIGGMVRAAGGTLAHISFWCALLTILAQKVFSVLWAK